MSAPVQVAVLETPAGFQPNSALVAEGVAEFLRQRLQNFRPEVAVVPARRGGPGPDGTDNPALQGSLAGADVLFLGPGSPTYAVRHLAGSLAWHTLTAAHRCGAHVVFASAAAVAVSQVALPVYEIFKVGDDPHWVGGLDFLGPYGLSLAIVPHWNNTEGGRLLDTSRCFLGQERFAVLLSILPASVGVLGLDEHTAIILDLAGGVGQVIGRGSVTVLKSGTERRFMAGESLDLCVLGDYHLPDPDQGLPPRFLDAIGATRAGGVPRSVPPAEVLALVQERQAARARSDWATADALRTRVAELGWSIRDTDQGPRLDPRQQN